MRIPRLRFYIRSEGSSRVGLGHLFRTLALARKIKETFTIKPVFWLSGGKVAAGMVKKSGFSLKIFGPASSPQQESKALLFNLRNGCLPVLIVDRPRLDGYENLGLKKRALLITIVNEKRRRVAGDMVIDVFSQFRKKSFSSPGLYLSGPAYQVLREEFLLYRKRYRPRKRLRRILITFGGSDPYGATLKLIKIIPRLPTGLSFTLLIGPVFSHRLSAKTRPPNFKIIYSSRQMARLMSQYDLCISGFGVTAYELACLGVPTLVVGQVDRELNFISHFCRRSGAINLGSHRHLYPGKVRKAIESVRDFQVRKKMWSKARQTVDGRGLERIINAIATLWHKA